MPIAQLYNRPIGVLDSGVGGLTVCRALMRTLPDENIIYIGDTARVPYGGKDRETLIQYGRELVRFLMKKNAKAIVFACGTLSSTAMEVLAGECSLPFIDVISSGVKACVAQDVKKIAFLATEATVASGFFIKKLTEALPEVQVIPRACPLFVPMAEAGFTQEGVPRLFADIYLRGLSDENPDAVLLGCTHYPLLLEALRSVIPNTPFIDMAGYTAEDTRAVLTEAGLLRRNPVKPTSAFYTTGDAAAFNPMIRRILGVSRRALSVSVL
jgi:glutamate racemase